MVPVTEPDGLPDLDSAQLDDAPPEPTRTRKERSDKGKPRGSRSGGTTRRSSTSLKQIADDLLVPYASFAAGMTMVAPTVAGVLMQRGEKTVDAIVALAAKNPRMLAALKKASVVGPAFEIAETALAVVVAGAMDFGRIPPEHPLGMMTGVSQVYAEMHPDGPPANVQHFKGDFDPAPFPDAMPPPADPPNGVPVFTGPPVTDASTQWMMPLT